MAFLGGFMPPLRKPWRTMRDTSKELIKEQGQREHDAESWLAALTVFHLQKLFTEDHKILNVESGLKLSHRRARGS